MEAGTAASPSTGSKTIADLIGRAADRYADRVAVRHEKVTLDAEEIVPWARKRGIADTSTAAPADHPEVRALVPAAFDRANARHAPAEQGRRFSILDHDLSQETGELTSTLKVEPAVVASRYAERFDALYGG